MSKRSPTLKTSSHSEAQILQARRNGSSLGFDFLQVSRPITSGINSSIPSARSVFFAGTRGLFVTHINLYFFFKDFIVSINFSSF